MSSTTNNHCVLDKQLVCCPNKQLTANRTLFDCRRVVASLGNVSELNLVFDFNKITYTLLNYVYTRFVKI